MQTSRPSEVVSQIAGLARSGRLQEAAMLAASVRGAERRDPVFLSLAGTVELHRGQFASAADYLGEAHRLRPADAIVRGNLIDALMRLGREDEAWALCSLDAARADRTLRIARMAGHLAQSREDFAAAADYYRLVVAAEPRDWATWNNLGNALSATDEVNGAVEALRKAAELAPDSQPIRVNLANALIEAGEGLEAEAVLLAAAREVPDDPQPQVALARLYGLAGREDAAFEALREAVRRAPDDIGLLSELGQEAVRMNHHDIAEQAFETVLHHAPGDAQAFVGLATIYERLNREDELEPLRQRAEAVSLAEEPLSFIDALRFKRMSRLDEAYAALERAGDIVAPGRTHHLRGVLLDRLGRHDEAFAAFNAMNEHWKEDPVRPVERAREYRGAVSRATAMLTPQWVQSWTASAPQGERPAPVFLLGFPRSGTTLLDTMLMADPSVRVLEEEAIIGEIEHDLGGIDALAGLTEAQIRDARDSYYERAGRIVDLDPQSRIVDKHPMHLNKAETIHRLFPEAKFLLALRHPCDVLLSCYLTNFRNNHAMANFLDLETAVELYDLSFTHWQAAQGLLNLDVRTVVYERLVDDTERELRPVFEWLALSFPESDFDHTRAARARGMVTTASYAQVTEPIYKRAAGRWRRYTDHLAPILPAIRPWAERFGYSVDDDRIPGWPGAQEQS